MLSNRTVTVFGAYGHTGRFVVAELAKRGGTPVLAGRDASRLHALSAQYPAVPVRVASIADAASLDRALAGSVAVINCAGPFVDTAAPLVAAALRAGIPYVDVAAEQRAVLAVFAQCADAARDAGVVVVPAMAFYGGLSDLLATAAMGDWDTADRICIATALDSWKPTHGTRLTGERNAGPRLRFSEHQLAPAEPLPARTWQFPTPFGAQEVVGLSLAEMVTISRHLQTTDIRAYINQAPLTDLHDPATPPPEPADASGRSSQIFLVDVVVRRGTEERRARARGRDIYAVTAPLAVEATERILAGRINRSGVVAAGEIFDAADFLHALCPDHLAIEIP